MHKALRNPDPQMQYNLVCSEKGAATDQNATPVLPPSLTKLGRRIVLHYIARLVELSQYYGDILILVRSALPDVPRGTRNR